VPAWSSSQAGKWLLSGGVMLEVRQQFVHAADVSSTAVLTWPKGKAGSAAQHKIWPAVDAFSVRQPWLLAWERGASELWTLSGSRQSPHDVRKVKATPESVLVAEMGSCCAESARSCTRSRELGTKRLSMMQSCSTSCPTRNTGVRPEP
jgi:hypothetical protein